MDSDEPTRSDGRLIAWGDKLRRVHQRLRSALELARDSVENAADVEDARELLLYTLTRDHSMIEHLIGGLHKALDSATPTAEKPAS